VHFVLTRLVQSSSVIDLQLSVNAYSDKLVTYTVAAVSLNGTGSVAPPAGLSFGVADGPGSMRARNKITAMQIRYECMKCLYVFQKLM